MSSSSSDLATLPSRLTVNNLDTVFADLTPIPQQDGPTSVCCIDYSADFVAAYDMLRSVMKRDERSERALLLTGLCLTLNPANYTVWHFRRVCLASILLLGKDDNDNDPSSTAAAVEEEMHKRVQKDLDFCATLGGGNPKNYQIWYHRRALIEGFVLSKNSMNNNNEDEGVNLEEKDEGTNYYDILLDYSRKELTYIENVLHEDGKNYHAWSHRQWILQTANDQELFHSEMAYIERLIEEDPSNNSAWNQRWFASHHLEKEGPRRCSEGGHEQHLSPERAKIETEYALAVARVDPNESPWRYWIAVLKEQIMVLQDAQQITDLLTASLDELWSVNDALCRQADDDASGNDPNNCPSLTSAAVDVLEWIGNASSLQRAKDLADLLATKYDPIRQKYWKMRGQQLEATMDEL